MKLRTAEEGIPSASGFVRFNWVTPAMIVYSFLFSQILFVADVFHPVGRFTIIPFYNGDVCQRRRWCGAMPMLLTGFEPNYISRLNLFDRFAPALYGTGASSYDQGLTQWMTMPGCPRARLKCDVGDRHARWSRCLM